MITARHDSQYRRYVSRFGQLNIRRDNRANVSVIPRHTPVVSIPVTRLQAATGLRIWRKSK